MTNLSFAMPLALFCLAGGTVPQTTPPVAPSTQVALLIGDQRSNRRRLTHAEIAQPDHRVSGVLARFLDDRRTEVGTPDQDQNPTVVMSLPASVDAAEDVLLARLKLKDDRLEVGRRRDVPSEVNPESLLALAIEPVEAGGAASGRAWRATPKSPLSPGEYAVVIRSVFYAFGVD